MERIVFLVRLFMLLLSCYGYIQYMHKTVRLELCIGLLFSGIGSVLFLAGILNLLVETTWVIWLGGLVLAGQSIKMKECPKNVMSLGVFFFLGLACFLLFLLRGSAFTHYDNFSHWGLVSQLVSQQGRFPNYSDNLILFTSYPLGSASFIFYITETLGRSAEWVQMYAQAILISGMLVSLFTFARNPVQAFVTAICSVFLLCGNICIVRNFGRFFRADNIRPYGNICIFRSSGRGFRSRNVVFAFFVVFGIKNIHKVKAQSIAYNTET